MGSNVFDKGGLSLPPSPFDSRQRAYKRRAYGSVDCVGNDQFSCGTSFKLSFDGTGEGKYAQGGALQARGGGRYTPNAHLTSITTKNQGGGDISDAALWEIEFQYTCYSKSQLDSCSNAFMVPGNLINVEIGYQPGEKLSITKARLYDFSWSYNADNGTYSCTGKCIGPNSKSGVAGALKVKPSPNKATQTDEGGGENAGSSLVEQIRVNCDNALDLKRDAKGDLTLKNVPAADGTAVSKPPFGLIKGQKDASGWSNFWSGGKADNVLIPVVQIGEVVAYFNTISAVKYEFDEGKYDTTLSLLKSADPTAFCLPGARAFYGDNNDFSKLQGTIGNVSDIYVSIPNLLRIETELFESLKEKGEQPTISQFLNRLFSELDIHTGGAIDCFITDEAGGGTETLKIVNRKFDIKKTAVTTINLLSKDSPVKEVNMSSNLDSDMAAIAFTGAGGKYPLSMVNSLFRGCTPKEDASSGTEPEDPGTLVQEQLDKLGENLSPEVTADLKGLLRQYVNSNVKNISIRYGIDISLTFDGTSGPRFMQKFTVSPMPNAISGAKIYFAVGEIEHKCDGETWDTSVVGYMMVG